MMLEAYYASCALAVHVFMFIVAPIVLGWALEDLFVWLGWKRTR